MGPRTRRARAHPAPDRPAHARRVETDVDRLLSRMREANERLTLAAVRAQDLSDQARVDAMEAKAEVDGLMSRLELANRQLGLALGRARTLAEDATVREAAYRRLSVRLLTLQDEERRRIAVDLHDATAQRLAALLMHLDLLASAAPALDMPMRRALAESRALAEQCSREVRTLAYVLHPPLLDEAGLVPAVRWFVEGFATRSGIHVELELGAIGRLPRPIETALFRIVQECLTNVHRHAESATASVRLAQAGDTIALDVHDQGRGRRDERTQSNVPSEPVLGVGIQGMRGRIAQLGGTFDLAFTKRGTTVRVRVPLSGNTE